MKKYLLLLAYILFMSSYIAQPGIDEIVTACKSANATELSRHFDNNVEITLPSGNNVYPKNQAVQVLQRFFNEQQPKSFELVHKGGNNASFYCIGILHARQLNFRATFYLKQVNNSLLVQEISFEKQ
jgi:hypothetical protein